MQRNLFFLNNQNLFSKNYLENYLPSTPLWSAQSEEVRASFETIKKIYKDIQNLKLGPGEEASLEDKFIRPVLKTLGFVWDVQPRSKRGAKKKRPDYALFKDKFSQEEASKEKDNLTRFFSNVLTILEAKYWGRRLNDADPKDTLDLRDPTAQTVKYLDDVYHTTQGSLKWAILTNGKLWRLFYYHAASRSGNFYEIDLEELVQRNSLEEFKYFYFFFSKKSFIPDLITNKTWLDQHLKGSEDYAARVSEKLKNLIFDRVFEGLAKGFIEYRRNELKIREETNENLKIIFNGCLTLLYRLLFLLYAESRGLLPVEDQNRYFKKSLSKLKQDINKDINTIGIDGMSHNAYDYWSRIESLCRIIDKGDKALNVPIYNGGLFETLPNSFLTKNKISDPYLAEAIKLLTIDPDIEHLPEITPFIDYSSLNVRHLGDIYEGLLEFHLRITEEPLVEIKDKGKSVWKPEKELKSGIKTYRKKEIDEVYIENLKHERRSTGSYYTPHYIVEYIVSNTVGNILNKRCEEATAIFEKLESLYEKQRRQLNKPKDWQHWAHQGEPKGEYIIEIQKSESELFEILFDIKVLDPAMGSGHFLVHAVDFISDKIITFLANYPQNPVIRKIEEMRSTILEEISRQEISIDENKLTEVNLIKRTVMKRCIYGVDLNRMAVELAKLSLWLDSFTLGAPLSFLDHHLKCGNSLIGILDISDVIIPGTESYNKIQRSLAYMLQISDLTDSTITEAKKSNTLFEHAQKEIDPIRRRFNIATAKYFLDLGGNVGWLENLAYTLNFDSETHPENTERCMRGLDFANEKNFFHWRIEFPEIFYNQLKEKENAGFDCVIGNPPWGANLSEHEKNYFRTFQTDTSTPNSYIYMLRRGELLLRDSALAGFILPDSLLVKDYSLTRQNLLQNNSLFRIIYLERVFEEVNHDTCIVCFQRGKGKQHDLLCGLVPYKEARIKNKVSILDVNFFDNEALEYRFNLNLNKENFALYKKLAALPKISDFGDFHEGIHTGNIREKLFYEEKPNYSIPSKIKPCLIGSAYGDEFGRYYCISNNNWVIYDQSIINKKAKEYASLRDENIFLGPKLYITRTGDDFYCFYDVDHYSSNNLFSFKFNTAGIPFSYFFIIAILNSSFAQRFNRLFLAPRFGRLFTETKIIHLQLLPIPSINFVTEKTIIDNTISKLTLLYHENRVPEIISIVENMLHEQKNDFVHDFLAFLAQEMTRMNNEKYREARGFSGWLEREFKIQVDNLTNKTAIKEYYNYEFNQFLDFLKKNQKNISSNLSDRRKQELIEKHFSSSTSIQSTLKFKISVTDKIIDKIVFGLYGLSDNEINILNESVLQNNT